jgi:Flp pilus assembly protein TadD
MFAELALALQSESEPRLFAGVWAATITALAAMTFAYAGSFRDARAFGEAAVAGSPHSALAHFCLGAAYQRAGKTERALAEYRASLAIEPLEDVHNNIAVIHMAAARWADAEAELRAELALYPDSARAHENLEIVQRHRSE